MSSGGRSRLVVNGKQSRPAAPLSMEHKKVREHDKILMKRMIDHLLALTSSEHIGRTDFQILDRELSAAMLDNDETIAQIIDHRDQEAKERKMDARAERGTGPLKAKHQSQAHPRLPHIANKPATDKETPEKPPARRVIGASSRLYSQPNVPRHKPKELASTASLQQRRARPSKGSAPRGRPSSVVDARRLAEHKTSQRVHAVTSPTPSKASTITVGSTATRKLSSRHSASSEDYNYEQKMAEEKAKEQKLMIDKLRKEKERKILASREREARKSTNGNDGKKKKKIEEEELAHSNLGHNDVEGNQNAEEHTHDDQIVSDINSGRGRVREFKEEDIVKPESTDKPRPSSTVGTPRSKHSTSPNTSSPRSPNLKQTKENGDESKNEEFGKTSARSEVKSLAVSSPGASYESYDEDDFDETQSPNPPEAKLGSEKQQNEKDEDEEERPPVKLPQVDATHKAGSYRGKLDQDSKSRKTPDDSVLAKNEESRIKSSKGAKQRKSNRNGDISPVKGSTGDTTFDKAISDDYSTLSSARTNYTELEVDTNVKTARSSAGNSAEQVLSPTEKSPALPSIVSKPAKSPRGGGDSSSKQRSTKSQSKKNKKTKNDWMDTAISPDDDDEGLSDFDNLDFGGKP